jgi:hypothetical protein
MSLRGVEMNPFTAGMGMYKARSMLA